MATSSFYSLSKRCLNCKGLSDATVLSLTKKEYCFGYIFVKIHKAFKFNVRRRINCYLLKLLFVWNSYNKKVGAILSNNFGAGKLGHVIKTRDMLSFLPNKSFCCYWFKYFIAFIVFHFSFFYLHCIHECFHKHHLYC